MLGPVAFGAVPHAGEGGSQDHALDGGVMFLDGGEYFSGAIYGRVEKVSFVVGNFHLEGAGCVDDLYSGSVLSRIK